MPSPLRAAALGRVSHRMPSQAAEPGTSTRRANDLDAAGSIRARGQDERPRRCCARIAPRTSTCAKLRHVRDVRFWPFRRRRNRAPRRIHSPRRRRGSSLADRHDVAQEFLAAAQPARRVLRRTDSRRPRRCSRSRHRGRERAGSVPRPASVDGCSTGCRAVTVAHYPPRIEAWCQDGAASIDEGEKVRVHRQVTEALINRCRLLIMGPTLSTCA
jgi:hypothetical protein